jgi:hypothetical protein
MGLDADLITIVLGGTAALHTVGGGGGDFSLSRNRMRLARRYNKATEWQHIGD